MRSWSEFLENLKRKCLILFYSVAFAITRLDHFHSSRTIWTRLKITFCYIYCYFWEKRDNMVLTPLTLMGRVIVMTSYIRLHNPLLPVMMKLLFKSRFRITRNYRRNISYKLQSKTILIKQYLYDHASRICVT